MKDEIFKEYAPLYWSASLPAMPLRDHTKVPLGKKWQGLCSRMPTDEEQATWLSAYPANNIGLPLGSQSGLCMVDIDTDDEDVIATIKALLPETPWERRGKKGMALAYRWAGEANFKIKGVDGFMLVELLGHGNQAVLSPSIHPDTGRPYVATSNLWEVMDQIPELPEGFEAKLRSALAAAGLAATTTRVSGTSRSSATGIDVAIPEVHGVDRFLAFALQAACDEILSAQEGSRNTTLFGQAKDLARHVAAAEADWGDFAAKLEEAALIAGLEAGEIPGSIASGWNAGSQEPTRWIQIAREYIYLGAQNRFYQPTSDTLLTPDGFNNMYGRAHLGKGAFSQFLTLNGFITKVQDVTYTPKEASGVQIIDGMPYFNMYRPSDVTATPGDATPYLEFLEYLVPDEAEREHLIKVIAHSVRHPGDRIRHAVLLRTRHQGVGKSMNFEIWGRLVGNSNVRFTSSREMQSNFDGWKTRNTLLICPELNIGEGLRAYNEIKSFITDDEASINEKHLAPRRWTIFSTPVFSSNLDVPLLIERDDRRLFVIDSPVTPRPDTYYTEFYDWWQANLGVIRHFLDGVDLSDFNPHAPPPMTEAKQRLIQRSAHPLVQNLAHIIEDRKGRLNRDVVTIEEVAEELKDNRVADRAIASALRELGGFSAGQQRTSKGRKSLWIIRNQPIWLKWKIADWVQEFERTEGLFAFGLSGLGGQDFDVVFLSDLMGVDMEEKYASLGSSTLLAL